MARIRKIEIQNFRGVKELVWLPSAGINCLIGPGDSGKSSILDAIDYCVGVRRNIQFTDADFHGLDVEQPIRISVTIGELDDALKNMDVYGLYVRGFDARSGEIEDEPEKEAETVLTVRLTVAGDLDPVGGSIRAMLDAHAVSFTGGTISLHDEEGVPLRGLGVGSTRLLIAGLQRKAASESSILLMDETEHGLEPHRIIRLLGSLGAKESRLPPLQVFMTTHSPVVLRELAGKQLFVVRRGDQSHEIIQVGTANGI